MGQKTPLRPQSIRLGGRDITFRYKKLTDCDGEFRSAESVIDIADKQLPINEMDTVLHEVMHAILFCQGREYGGKTEELYVRALATGLTAALHDNPEFAQWLLQRSPQ